MQLFLAILIGKIIFFLSRLLKTGGGSAAPGLYALKIDPQLIGKLAKQIPQQIVVTGTNGKTTTSRLLAQFLTSQKLQVIKNATGSNLERGVASALLQQATLFGKITSDVAVWELDEAAFTTVFPKVKPQQVMFLNAFRDQLDRYGEVDSIIKRWQQTLSEVSWPLQAIVNNADNNTAFLAASITNQKIHFVTYAIKDHQPYQEPMLMDTFKKLPTTFEATILKNNGLDGVEFSIREDNTQLLTLALPVPGIYNVYNFLAAFCAYQQLNLSINSLKSTMTQYTPAFGRVEKIEIQNKTGYIFLIKNPAGADAVFETIKPELSAKDTILIALNDNFADGTDVSWIWDAPIEKLFALSEDGPHPQILCSGKRAYDIALRIKYAGVDPNVLVIKNDLVEAFDYAVKNTAGRLFIFPTYTALLDLQQILAKNKIKKEYWKE